MLKHRTSKTIKDQILVKIKDTKAITLIALVVTIVVLLILAGITIQLVFSDGGIFNQAQNAKVQTRVGELLDKFNMSEAVLAAEKLGKISLEEYIKQIQEKEGYVIEVEEQDDGSYNVTTEDGYVFNVSIIEGNDINDIVIEYIGQAGNLPPAIKVKNVTTNSAEVEVIRTEGATNYKYEYKKHGEETYQTATGNSNTCIFTGLTSNTIYDIKVTVRKDGQEIVIEKQIAVGQIPTGGVIKLKSVTWSNNKATAVVYHEESASYRIEWQLMGSTTWNQGEIGVKEISIPNLNHNDTILLRLNDGTSSGSDASVSIIDDKAPQPATISFNLETAKVGENIIATVTMQDNESGINNSNSKYEFNQSSVPLGTDESKYAGTFGTTISPTIKATSSGNWYLHVLSVDNAGNKIETISKPINIKVIVESITLDKTTASVDIGETVTIKATVTPENAEDKSVTWSVDEPEIATVDQTGAVTGLAYGTATVTAIANDGSGVRAICNVIVEETESDWGEIAKWAKQIANSSTTSNSTSATVALSTGGTKTITVGDVFKVKYDGVIKSVRVLGFNHDILVDKTVYGGNNETAGISFEFYDFMTGKDYKAMNSTNTNTGGWANTEMRKFLNGAEVEEKLSNRSYIKEVTKEYISTYNVASTSTCDDYLWLLACSEIVSDGYKTGYYGYAITSEGKQYQYYKEINPIWNAENMDLVKRANTTVSAERWWLRSPRYDSANSFCSVMANGQVNRNLYGNYTYGVAPGFCI